MVTSLHHTADESKISRTHSREETKQIVDQDLKNPRGTALFGIATEDGSRL